MVQRALVSEVEFLALPESTQHIELIDGEVVVSPSPSYWHQELLKRLVWSLEQWARTQTIPYTVGMSPLDIRFAAGRILQPDAFVLQGTVARDHSGPLTQIPQLVVEVVSQDRVYDRVTKRLLYAEAGVEEYWLVEPSGLIERRRGARLEERDEHADGVLCSKLLPGFNLELSELFRER